MLYGQLLEPCDWMLYLQCNFVFPEYKKARQDIKKAASDTIRLQKKVKKGQWGSYREVIFLFVKVKLQLFNSDFCIKVYFTYLLKAPASVKEIKDHCPQSIRFCLKTEFDILMWSIIERSKICWNLVIYLEFNDAKSFCFW